MIPTISSWASLRWLALVACFLTLTGCVGTGGNSGSPPHLGSFFSRGAKSKPVKKTSRDRPVREEKPQLVGTIRVLQDGFVLIHSRLRTPPGSGISLTAFGPDGSPRDVELTMSEERKGAFLVADVVRGLPEVGDRVMTVPPKREDLSEEYQFLE